MDAIVLLAAVLGLAVVVISFVPCRWGGALDLQQGTPVPIVFAP